jgi:ribosomal-protein-alanine N-acetyltransferase
MSIPIQTNRLKLLPFTVQICEETLSGEISCLTDLGIAPAKDWPDLETLDTLPRILTNLNKVPSPSGFESWMIIHKSTNVLIGDIGFKGTPNEYGQIDLGYGIVQSETQKGYAKEAALGLIEWAFMQAEVKMITASCSKENFASQKILVFLNFKKVEERDEMIYWELLK